MNDNVIKDIMVQNYRFDNYYDPTKLFIFLSLTYSNELSDKYLVLDIAKSVYRLFISNLNMAKSNLNITIRNIQKYGIIDIVPHIISTINQIIREQVNGSFKLIGDYLYVNFDEKSESASKMISLVCNTLFKKYYKKEIIPINDYKECQFLDDKKIDEFGVSSIKNLIFEDLQYCPLCEETNKEKLYVTHILLKNESNNELDSINKNNLLLMCKDEWIDYVNGLFYFDEFGRVVNNGSKNVNNRMRISQSLLNNERKEYIKKHIQYLLNNE